VTNERIAELRGLAVSCKVDGPLRLIEWEPGAFYVVPSEGSGSLVGPLVEDEAKAVLDAPTTPRLAAEIAAGRRALGEALDEIDRLASVLDAFRVYVASVDVETLRTSPSMGPRADRVLRAGAKAVLSDVKEILGRAT